MAVTDYEPVTLYDLRARSGGLKGPGPDGLWQGAAVATGDASAGTCTLALYVPGNQNDKLILVEDVVVYGGQNYSFDIYLGGVLRAGRILDKLAFTYYHSSVPWETPEMLPLDMWTAIGSRRDIVTAVCTNANTIVNGLLARGRWWSLRRLQEEGVLPHF